MKSDNMIQVKAIEFYITNVCNLTCTNCNRFNNHDFKGRYDFDLEMYKPWAKKVNFEKITIMGGEPTLHPKLGEWIENISLLWPFSRKRLYTNGTRLVNPNNHELLAKYNWTVHVNLHGKKNSKMNKEIIRKIKDNWGPLKNLQRQNHALLANTNLGASIQIHYYNLFHDNAFKDQKNFTLHNGDPNKAHHYCTMKTCHHMIEGKMYKCGVVKLVPDLLKQKKLPYPGLYDEYEPLTVDNITQEKVDNLRKNSIPQCKFCPDQKSSWQTRPFESENKNKKSIK